MKDRQSRLVLVTPSRRLNGTKALLLALGLSMSSLLATPPAWWGTRGATSSAEINDFGALNQGQLKHFTQKAVEELNARIPGGAGVELNGLIESWETDYATNNYSPTNPNPADFGAIALGQLKWVGKLLHDRLVYAKWQDQLPIWLLPNAASDSQLANIGQLKTVFNFDLGAPTGQLPEWWQKFYYNGQTGIDPNGDTDGDGISNVDEYLASSNPNDSPGEPEPPSLVAHWKMNEPSGTSLIDSGPDGHTGAILGGAARWGGMNGLGGLLFDGNDDSVRSNPASQNLLNFGQNSFSVSAWFKTENSTGLTRLVSKGFWQFVGGYFLSMGHSGPGRLTFGVSADSESGSGLVSTTEMFNDGEWHHVVGVCDRNSKRIRIYVDGVAREVVRYGATGGTLVENNLALDINGLTTLNASHSDSLYLGSAEGDKENFSGELDDVRIFGNPLDLVSVQDLWNIDEDENGVPDRTESSVDPFADTDGDGIPDIWEFANGLDLNDPTDALFDLDSDGYNHLQEYVLGTDPNSPDTLVDSDGDKMPDIYEIANDLEVNVDDSLEDKDGDRVPNVFEFKRGTHANDSLSKPAATFVVNPSTGGNSSADNIYSTIGEAVEASDEWYWDEDYENSLQLQAYSIIQVEDGVYAEQVSLDGVPVLLLGKAGQMGSPPIIKGRADYDDVALVLYSASVVDGFVITHSVGRKGRGVQVGSYYDEISLRRRLVNCVIRNNEADSGGGIYNYRAYLDIVHCTVFGNKGNYQGRAIHSTEGVINLVNSITWGNMGDATEEIYSNSSIGSSVIVSNSIVNGGGHGGINEDPRLTPMGWLLSDSPAINRPGLVGAATETTDIHGEIRPVAMVSDLGADEYLDSNNVDDNDGLPDWVEAITDDGDGLDILDEYLKGTDPTLADTDADGLNDGSEIENQTDPLQPDSDHDGMTDGWEVVKGLKPNFNDSLCDPDNDRYPNLYEFYAETDPFDSAYKPTPDYIVDPNGVGGSYTTIGDAMNVAYQSGVPRKIIGVLPGTYTPTSEGNTNYHNVGNEVLLVAISGPASTVLSGGTSSKYFSIGGVISGFGITNMTGPAGYLREERAGIVGCKIYGNTTIYPLVSIGSSGASIVDTEFVGNQSPSIISCGKGIITNCRFEANTGLTYGVLMRSDSGKLEVYNSLFTNNVGNSMGVVGCFDTSRLSSDGYAAAFVNCTVAGNIVQGGGSAGLFYLSTTTPPVEVHNSIVWGNNSLPIFKGTQSKLVINYSDIQGGYSGSMNRNVDPLFGVGYKITAASPCLDLASSNRVLPFDYDYAPRVMGSYADLGPHEVGNGDSDNDGLPDTWEIQKFGNITARNGNGDEDNDGITNVNEYLWEKPPGTYNGVQDIEVLDTVINAASGSRNMRIRFTSYLNQTVTLKFHKFYYDFNITTGDFGQPRFELIATKTHSAVVGENIYTWDGIVSPPSGFHSADVVAVEVISTQPSPGSATEVIGQPSSYVAAQQITPGVSGVWTNPSGTGTTQYHNVPTPVTYSIAGGGRAILNTKSHHTLLQNRPVTQQGLAITDWIPIADNGSTYGTGAVYAPTTVTGRNLPALAAIYENQYPEISNFTVQSYRTIPSNGEVGHIRFSLSKPTQVTLELADSGLTRYSIYVRQSDGTYLKALNLPLEAGSHDLEFKVLNYQVNPALPTHFSYQKVVQSSQSAQAGFFRVRAEWVKDSRLQGSTVQQHRGFKWAHIHVE